MEKTYKDEGLKMKYIISKVNGEPVDSDAEYFVLRLDDGASDKLHLSACRKAVLFYANLIKDHIPKLASELIDRYETEVE